jgi:hypothetical protein
MANAVKPTPNADALVSAAGFAVLFAILMFWIAYGTMTGELGLPRLGWGVFPAVLLAFAVLLILMAVSGARGARFWWRLEQRRQAAALGDEVQTFPKVESPASVARPSLPATISIRVNRKTKLTVWGCFGLLVITLAGWQVSDHRHQDYRFDVGLVLMLATFGFFAAAITEDQRIVASEAGLTVRAMGIKNSIPWDETCLFATFRGKHAAWQYELSGADAIASWVWVRPGTFSARLYEPTIPQYEYDLQMEALLALIAAKTGLPLYDLR